MPYIDVVREQADANREALGFLPDRVYREAAEQGKLLVALAVEGQRQTYAGHLLFGGAYPRARVFQIFLSPSYREKGVGRRLVEDFVHEMEADHYISITANVAADLVQSNAFWKRIGFHVVRTRQGGAARGRSLNVFARDLDTPNLFSLTNPVAYCDRADLRLLNRLSTQAPLYVLDLNVLFDLVKRLAERQGGGPGCKGRVHEFRTVGGHARVHRGTPAILDS